MPKSVEQWVNYIQGLHAREIDLNLDRVREVYQRLVPNGVEFKVVIVAGTNGKGSTCELLASIYDSAGFTTAKYTSPHIRRFNERFNIDRQDASDSELLAAFTRVEAARGSTGLTYFEFGTLVAIMLFVEHDVDVAIMEVGLGGRLDAVNILDADIAVVTSISIDHTDWLGDSISEIAREKIAVTRSNRPCVIGISEPPEPMLEYCQDNGVPLYCLGSSFGFSEDSNSRLWRWFCDDKVINNLPLPFSQSGVQLENASVTLQVVNLMQQSLPVTQASIYKGLEHA